MALASCQAFKERRVYFVVNAFPVIKAFGQKTWWVFTFALLLWLAGGSYAYHANEAA